ncbi:MAG: GtrA family protein [Candidatus Altiarchaeota archaeon]
MKGRGLILTEGKLKNISENQFMRFLAVGVVNTIFGYLAFAFFIYLGLHYSIAALLGTVVGVLFNFKTTGRLVFKNQDNSRIVGFIVVYCIVYSINVLFLAFFNMLKISNYIAGAILILPLGVIAFLLNKWFVFKN